MWGCERCSPARFLPGPLVGGMLFFCLPAFAQEEVPVFRTGTTLVEFTLIAIDRNGNPVSDLTHEEIVVKDKGRPRELAFFRYEGGEQSQAPPPLPAGVFTNRADKTPGPPRNITAILLDTLNTPARDQVWVKAQVTRYLRDLPPDTRVAIYLLGQKLAVLHDFTNDTESLRARIEPAQLRAESQTTGDIELMAQDAEALIASLSPELQAVFSEITSAQIGGEMLANEQKIEGRTNQTLRSLEDLGDHLAGIPGRKSLVWISGGISMLTLSPHGGVKSYESLVRDTSRRLAQQGITLYMVDSRGLRPHAATAPLGPRQAPRGSGQEDPFERFRRDAEISNDPLSAMYKIANVTGGRVFWDTNDMAKGMKAVASDSKGTYSLGFYADAEAGGTWRDLNVDVKRRGVKVLHRSGYLPQTVTDAPLEWTEDQWQAAIYNPISSTAVRLDAMGRLGKRSETQTAMLMLQIVADDLHFRSIAGRSAAEIELAVVEKMPDGHYRMQKDAMTLARPQSSGAGLPVVSCRHMWELLPGAATIRLILRDRFTGRHGTLDLPVKDIPPVTAEDFGLE